MANVRNADRNVTGIRYKRQVYSVTLRKIKEADITNVDSSLSNGSKHYGVKCAEALNGGSPTRLLGGKKCS